MQKILTDIIYSSIRNLFENQPNIFENTTFTNYTEWNLSYHFSNELSKYLYFLNVDIDVTKRNYKNRRPDIIFHKRGTNELNFLVIELKKDKADKRQDIPKIKEDWMQRPLYYPYGSYVNIWGLNKFEAILFDGYGNEFVIDEGCNYIENLHTSYPLINTVEELYTVFLNLYGVSDH